MHHKDFLFLMNLCIGLLLYSCVDDQKTEKEPATEVSKAKSTGAKPLIKKEAWPKRGAVEQYFSAYGEENKETRVMLKTTFGNIEIELFKDTPLHRANFIHHIKRGLYDKTIFYRVAPEFVIQGGNSDHDKTMEKRKLVDSYYIPSEAIPNHFHKKGALAAAMNYQNNPENKSSQYDWYIVIGKSFSEAELDATAEEYKMNIPANRRKVYTTIGGAPHLDGKHTVFGQVISGMETVEAISKVKRDGSDWPINDIFIDYHILN